MKRDHSSLKYIKAEEEDKTEVIVREIIRTGYVIYQTGGIEDSLGEVMVNLDFNRVIEGTIFEIVLGDMEDKIAERSIEVIIIGLMVTIEVGIDQERDHSQETIVVIELEAQATVGQGQDPEPVLIGIE